MVPFLASDCPRICLCLHPQTLLISTEIGKPILITAPPCLQPSNWIGQTKSLMSSFPDCYITSEGCTTPFRSLGRIRRQPAWKPPFCFGASPGEERDDPRSWRWKWPSQRLAQSLAEGHPLSSPSWERWIISSSGWGQQGMPQNGQQAGTTETRSLRTHSRLLTIPCMGSHNHRFPCGNKPRRHLERSQDRQIWKLRASFKFFNFQD